ncbi:uncharacterized protein isoform X2 [Takifugu rubripes]|uniref:uncharacterized protein isoform X2 n=1 Tax=Takifugu rubripes TaxID=31033 RepID=UPI0011454439|nr:uncharacterized protein LOC115248597 isoform X2 [Takifugu rubripes]
MIKMIFIIIKIVFITIRIIFIILILIILYQSILHSVSNKRECFPLKVPEEPSSIQEAELDEIPGADQTCADEAAPLENMPIPSVIIEPASSNEGDDDRDGDIISPTAASDNDVTTVSQTMKHMSPSGGVSGLPDDFLYKVTSAFNGLSQDAAPPSFFADFDQMVSLTRSGFIDRFSLTRFISFRKVGFRFENCVN